MAMLDILKNVTWLDFLDIILVAFLVYRVILLLKGTQMIRLLSVFAVLLACWLVARIAGLAAFYKILDSLVGSIILIIVVIYQHEIRRALFSIGKRRPVKGQPEEVPQLIEELAMAADALSGKRIGALIVLQGEMDIDN